jgi:hypothetical protein
MDRKVKTCSEFMLILAAFRAVIIHLVFFEPQGYVELIPFIC